MLKSRLLILIIESFRNWLACLLAFLLAGFLACFLTLSLWRTDQQEIHSISPLFLGIKERYLGWEVILKSILQIHESELEVKTIEESMRVNLSLQWKKKWREKKNELLNDQTLLNSLKAKEKGERTPGLSTLLLCVWPWAFPSVKSIRILYKDQVWAKHLWVPLLVQFRSKEMVICLSSLHFLFTYILFFFDSFPLR